MSGSGIDEDMAIALIAGALAAVCLALAVRGFSNRRIGAGLAWLFGAAVFGFVVYFFAIFTIRMF
jgi:hypothetical protein